MAGTDARAQEPDTDARAQGRGTDALAQGRRAHRDRQWATALRALRTADERGDLDGADLDLLAQSAQLTGHHDEAVATWERAHTALLDAGKPAAAARVAFWAGIVLALAGQHAPGAGWMQRARRVLDDHGLDVVERGFLLLPRGLQLLEASPDEARDVFARATTIADEHDDVDLQALGRLGQGQALVHLARADRGVELLDEAMAMATSGRVSPLATGIIYCTVILHCQKVFDLRRAHEWTKVLHRWCEQQEGLQPYRGQCLVHRSEIMQLSGDWDAAQREVSAACTHLGRSSTDPVMGMAHHQQAQLLRERGDLEGAEQAYRAAAEWGHEVQPGLARLRLAQGRVDDAVAAVRRVLQDTSDDPVRRSRVLAACVEVELAAGDVDRARRAADELEVVAADFDTQYIHAIATTARGAVELANGDASRASTTLQAAWQLWQHLQAPYEGARVRLLRARALQRLGDHDTASVHLAAARSVFERLGAAPALAEVDAVATAAGATNDPPGGLTAREVEVLQLVATGATNRGVAETLVISEKTVARHLSNIYRKLDLSSRTAATAWAFDHDLA